MGKKSKKAVKINQKIRQYFDDDPFDVGVERVSVGTLSELFHSLGIYDVEHNKRLLLKAIRGVWSDGDVDMRRRILDFFVANGTVYKSGEQKEPSMDRAQKIEALMQELDVDPQEAALLYEGFMDVRSKKITIEKMESKLAHIRMELKRDKLARELDGMFELDNSFEFNASLRYELAGHCFHKILTLATKPYDSELLKNGEFSEIIERIQKDKAEITRQRQETINKFLSNVKVPHRYLSEEEMVSALKQLAPRTKTDYPPIPKETLVRIVKESLNVYDIELHQEELLLKLNALITLPKSSLEVSYLLDVHVELNALLKSIWYGEDINLQNAIESAKKETEGAFLVDLDYLVAECAGHAQLLKLSDEQLRRKVYAVLVDYLPHTLSLSAKTIRKSVKLFLKTIQDEVAKKQRHELLARTIRDFKNLFPLARSMNRKLTLHMGPTNSGKTYEAMQKLQRADTGYYLAPLRLLALEGYEELQEKGIAVSLITGEEQQLAEGATHISSTIEMLNFEVDVDVCIIDEVQMIDDRDRGWAWANAIIGAPAKEIIMTGSVNAKEAIIALAEYLGEPLEIIEFERKNPLTLLDHETKAEDVEEGSAIIAFSRKDVLKLKQSFSRYFSISVVYGNLSPEVRREEARKFREGETQILIATDAIAMGMNLPIKTILFAKSDKFDGIVQRDLIASEVHQISGRAGRYGLSEEGFVGALSADVLKVVKKNFHKEARAIAMPFKVMANLEHIKLVSNILEEKSLSEILKFFVQNMEFNGPFVATNIDTMAEAALIVDSYDLDIATKYHLACAPLTLKSSYITSVFESYVLALEKKEIIPYHPPALIGSYAQTTDELLRAEDMVKEISLYLWLSYRFSDYFLDVKKAREARGVLNRFIEESLHQSHFVPRCKLCNAPLPMNTKYTICQSCFKKYYTNKPSNKRPKRFTP